MEPLHVFARATLRMWSGADVVRSNVRVHAAGVLADTDDGLTEWYRADNVSRVYEVRDG